MMVGTCSTIENQFGWALFMLLVPRNHIAFSTSTNVEFSSNTQTLWNPPKLKRAKRKVFPYKLLYNFNIRNLYRWNNTQCPSRVILICSFSLQKPFWLTLSRLSPTFYSPSILTVYFIWHIDEIHFQDMTVHNFLPVLLYQKGYTLSHNWQPAVFDTSLQSLEQVQNKKNKCELSTTIKVTIPFTNFVI